MSAAVCGNKRTYFFDEEIPSPPSQKRLRRCSSPIRIRSPSSVLRRLKSLFPHAESQLIERTLEECGNDLDSAIKSLHEHSLGSGDYATGSDGGTTVNVDEDNFAGTMPNGGDGASENTRNVPVDGAEWVNVFVNEMMNALSVDDARVRASQLLEILEKSIGATAAENAAKGFQKENLMLKEQMEGLVRENTILKRAVSIQHERQKDFDNKAQELQHVKQILAQYQEKLRELEVTNYALSMHLRQAQQSTPIPGRFNPDVF